MLKYGTCWPKVEIHRILSIHWEKTVYNMKPIFRIFCQIKDSRSSIFSHLFYIFFHYFFRNFPRNFSTIFSQYILHFPPKFSIIFPRFFSQFYLKIIAHESCTIYLKQKYILVLRNLLFFVPFIVFSYCTSSPFKT